MNRIGIRPDSCIAEAGIARLDSIYQIARIALAQSVVSSKLQDAGIPFIAVDIPHPGATYYGANNYQAGVVGGRHLARWAIQNWAGKVDEVLLLELPPPARSRTPD